jgi:multiple sugar transport system permease protein
MLPLAIPALFTVAIVNFGGAWNDYVWPLVSASETHMRTLQVGMSLQLGNRLGMYMGTSLAGIIISTMPTIFLLVYFQKYLLRCFAIGTK